MERKAKTIRRSIRFRRWSRKAVSVFISCTSHVTIGRVSNSIADASCRKSAKDILKILREIAETGRNSVTGSPGDGEDHASKAVLLQCSLPFLTDISACTAAGEKNTYCFSDIKPERQFPELPDIAAFLFLPC